MECHLLPATFDCPALGDLSHDTDDTTHGLAMATQLPPGGALEILDTGPLAWRRLMAFSKHRVAYIMLQRGYGTIAARGELF